MRKICLTCEQDVKMTCDNNPCGPGLPLRCDKCGKVFDWWCGHLYEDQQKGETQYTEQCKKYSQVWMKKG